MKHIKLFEDFRADEADELKLTTDDKKKLEKQFTIDGKYAFDDRLSDDEKEAILMAKVEEIIKQKKLNKGQADKVRRTWRANMKKVGVGEFEEQLKRRWIQADKKLTGGRLDLAKEKIKGAIWKGYRRPVMKMFDDLADIITGAY